MRRYPWLARRQEYPRHIYPYSLMHYPFCCTRTQQSDRKRSGAYLLASQRHARCGEQTLKAICSLSDSSSGNATRSTESLIIPNKDLDHSFTGGRCPH